MGERTLIRGGIVISLDDEVGDHRVGDVLIEDGAILAVGASIEAQAAEVIDASGMVVMPGLVDAHRHLWYGAQRAIAYDGSYPMLMESVWPKIGLTFEPADVYASMRAGIADALNAGVTCLLDWCHVMNSAAHVEAALSAHVGSPLRAVFGFGPSMARKGQQNGAQFTSWDPARRARDDAFAGDRGLHTVALAIQGTEYDSVAEAEHDITAAREMGMPVTMHVGYPQGKARRAIAKLHEAGVMGADLQFVHCNATTTEEVEMIVDAGARVALTPATEVTIGMGIPPIAMMRAHGVPPGFGCDAIIASSGDLFDEARAGVLVQRAVAQQQLYLRGEEVASAEQLGFTSREALEAITINAARSIWLEDQVGSLTPGKCADVILLRADDWNLAPMNDAVATILACANASNVDTVLVDGKVVKRGGALVGCDREEILSELRACRERMFAQADYDGISPPAASGAGRRGREAGHQASDQEAANGTR